MIDPQAQNLGIGGALFITALWLILKYKPWRNGNGKRQNASGEQTIDFWDMKIQQAVESGVKKGIESAFAARPEALTEVQVQRIMKEVIGDWLDKRVRKE
jgi:hypothetical protein